MLSVCSRGLVLVVVVIAVAAQLCHARSEWNQETRDLIVKIHNDLRRNEGGCQVNKLEYDHELEKKARQWAEACSFHHSTEERGENLAWSGNKWSENDLIQNYTQKWFDEKKTYSYGQHDCGASRACHYTQMVWGKTNKIGCYSTFCNYLAHGGPNAWYLVCIYQPKGNWKGEKIYEKSCPTPCLKGQTEEDGLCVGEPEKEPVKCEDANVNCALWASTGQCKGNPAFMGKSCLKSCKLCQSDEAEACEDIHSSCAQWESFGQCKSNPTYMKHNCKKTCGEC